MNLAADPIALTLLQAGASTYGIAVKVSNVRDARNILHVRLAKLPELRGLTIAGSPFNPEGELWLIPRQTQEGTGTVPAIEGE